MQTTFNTTVQKKLKLNTTTSLLNAAGKEYTCNFQLTTSYMNSLIKKPQLSKRFALKRKQFVRTHQDKRRSVKPNLFPEILNEKMSLSVKKCSL